MRKSTIRTLAGFIRKELIQAVRDPRMRLVLFIAPIIQMTVFGLAISSEIKNIRLASVYRASDRIAREIMERSYASQWFLRADVRGENPFDWIRSGQADAVLVAPAEGITRSLERGEGQAQLLVDATNVVRAQSVENYLRSIVSQVVAEQGAPAAPMAAPALKPELRMDVRILYNPAMESAVFMVPAVLSLLLCVVTILLTSMSMAREKEIGTFEMIISAPVKAWEILLGKTLPFALLGIIDIPLILSAAILIFKIPMRGQVWVLTLATIVFICTTVSIGTLISTYAKNQQQAMMGSFIFLFLAILLSGFMFPLENMPAPMLALTYLDPLRYFVALLRNIMLKGGDPAVVWSHVGVMTLMAIASILAAFKRFKPTL